MHNFLPTVFLNSKHSNFGLTKVGMKEQQPNNPLHGVTLEKILIKLVDRYGWEELGNRIPVNCFINNPSIKSSLTFLRKTPWAREKVEALYVNIPTSSDH